MKKLFSTMLAATMVAGTAVTAFAHQEAVNMTTTTFDGQEYGLIGAYDEDGNKLKDSAKIDGGDKLYYPILISGDELDKDGLNDTDMFFATKASEVDDLKASVKDEVGGKYIDDAAIVKKNINIDNKGIGITAGEKQSFKVDMSKISIGTAIEANQTVTLNLDAAGSYTTAQLLAGATVADIIAALENAAEVADYNVTVSGTTMTFTAKNAAANKVLDTTPDITVGGTGAGALTGDVTATVIKDGVASTGSSTDALNKVYCVEVKMSDYFKSEETEVEFNIKLKNSGRTEFDTDDDKITKGSSEAFFNGTFDLGKDSEQLKHGKESKTNYGYDVDFGKDGDLELEIGPDTRSVQLEDAIAKDDKEYDIEKIFLESSDEIDQAFTFDVKASGQDDLYLELNDDAVKDLAVSNQKADLTFFNFPGKPEFDFAGTATFAVEDEDEDNYFYEIVDGELVETNAKYDSRDGVFELRTNKLGSYVISDKELDTAKEDEKADDTEDKANENGGGDATETVTPGANGEKGNANTGAADLIGVASALAVVSVAAAGAVALKK